MFRTSLFAIAAVALLATTARAQSSGCGAVLDHTITDPPQLAWTQAGAGTPDAHWTATLEIGEETLCVDGETITTRVYRVPGTTGTIPGPTMMLEPDQRYVLRFRNVLPYAPLDPDHNVLKDANVSNIHTHGLHISGETPADDVTRSFEGGAGGDFVYDIPADHMGGTFWYHAHHHGSTFLQVSAGAFGLLLIDDSSDPGIPQNVRDMDERHLVIAYLDPDVAGSGGDTLISGTLDPTWTVNGKVQGDIFIPSDTWQHWRILLADRDARLKTLAVGAGCEAALLARDGVWRTEAPKVLADNALELTGASRADLAVRCTGASAVTVDGEIVANILLSGTPDLTPHPFAEDGISTWSAARPWYLEDLRGAVPDNSESINMGARTVAGSKFDPDTPTLVLDAAGIQEWSLKGAQNHPFHLHVYHVQVQGDCGPYEDGEYYDVIAGNCTLRFNLDADAPGATVYAGRTIMHCHILEHEDQGAMGWLDVIGGDPPPSFPAASPPYSVYYPPGVAGPPPPNAPTNLIATAFSSNRIDLAWTDNAVDEDGFDIERSSGGSYVELTSVGPDVTTYSDTGLTAGTAYTYRVRAFTYATEPGADGPVSTYSNEASATTLSGTTPSAMEVGSVSVSIASDKGTKYGQAEVVILDDLGGSVAGATVHGEFDYDMIELTAKTDAGGLAALTAETPIAGKGKLTVQFCVTQVTHPTFPDRVLADNPVCGSN